METILVVLGMALFGLLFIRAIIKKKTTTTTPTRIGGGGSGGDEGTLDGDTVQGTTQIAAK